ncbi:hypothetical protein LTR15_005870 [Elasticomyces elasticus]|nr:hypothetical protein LTR15_005870 [Elasticomyces elasticus]
MDRNYWTPPDFSGSNEYLYSEADLQHVSPAPPLYAHRLEQFDLLGPLDAAVPIQTTNIDADDIDRFLRTTNNEPYAAGQRPPPSHHGHQALCFPGEPGPFGLAGSDRHHQGPVDFDSNDSAYLTSNGVDDPCYRVADGQTLNPGYDPYVAVPDFAKFEYASNAETESVLSGPAVLYGRHQEQPKRPRPRSKSLVPPCHCGRILKNPSDAQPYVCDEVGCGRKEGFATQNDLQRHRSSVHQKTPSVGRRLGFICRACPPPQPGQPPKYWPRRDNFKAHVKRKHNLADLERIIQFSETPRPDDAMTVESGYGTASHVGSLDHGYQDELSSPTVPGLPGQQQGDYLFGIEASAQVDTLAGIGVGAVPLADSGCRESDFGIHAAGGRYGLSVLSTAASAMALSSLDDVSSPMLARICFGVPQSDHVGVAEQMRNRCDAMQLGAEGQNQTMMRGIATNLDYEASKSYHEVLTCPECHKVKKRECDMRYASV